MPTMSPVSALIIPISSSSVPSPPLSPDPASRPVTSLYIYPTLSTENVLAASLVLLHPSNTLPSPSSSSSTYSSPSHERQLKYTCHNATCDSTEAKPQKFRGWEGTDTFTMCVVPFSPYCNASSAGSEYLGSSLPHSAQQRRRARDPPSSASWAVVNMITAHVAVLWCGERQYVGKWFGVRPDWSAEEHEGKKLDAEVNIDNELIVYTVCHALQGAGIPHCYGIGEMPGVAGRVLVLEHIPGPTVAQLVGGGLDCVPGKKEGLVGAAGDVIRALHLRGVVHLDLHPWNMVVFAGDTVVVVDFDMSMVCSDGGSGREWEDWVLLKAAFEA